MNEFNNLALVFNHYYQDSLVIIKSIHFRDLLSSFILIASAEMGDKSQLVCMTLASRHRAMPVLLGAIVAFAFLNSLAVLFGAAIALWLPDFIVAGGVALLFALFGFHALLAKADNNEAAITEKSNHGVFFTTLLMITFAEFGDKTQLAVVALGSSADPIEIWLGATAALSFTSAMGIIAGRAILKHLPLKLLQTISGSLFLVLSVLAAYKCYLSYSVFIFN